MMSLKVRRFTFVSSVLLACCLNVNAQEKAPPNVLLIAVDDLNDWVGCLDGHPDTRTPNIDRLAKRGVLFSNAHCQSTMCNPSRTSIMFGMRPSTSGFYNNPVNGAKSDAFTSKHVSMSRHFAAGGYKTLTSGKIYHGSVLPPNDFEVVGPLPGQKNPCDKVVQKTLPSGMHKAYDFGPQSYEDKHFNDYGVASLAVERLGEKHERPFFMALGFYRPRSVLCAGAGSQQSGPARRFCAADGQGRRLGRPARCCQGAYDEDVVVPAAPFLDAEEQ